MIYLFLEMLLNSFQGMKLSIFDSIEVSFLVFAFSRVLLKRSVLVIGCVVAFLLVLWRLSSPSRLHLVSLIK
jgi:hypothetical protein